MEIERKYLVNQVPADYMEFPCHAIEQAYLCTSPVVRIRKEDDSYYLTYTHLLKKADGIILTKTRYLIPLEGSDHLTIELDIFDGTYKGLILAEVEFPTEEEALTFIPPQWFGKDVTFSGEYQNSRLACDLSR